MGRFALGRARQWEGQAFSSLLTTWRNPSGRLQLGGISLGLLLLDLVFQDGHLGPARYGMGGDPSAKADAVLGDTKTVAPDDVALGQGATENGVLGDAGSFTLHHAALCHAYDLFSLNQTNQSITILVINSSMICAGDHTPDSATSPIYSPSPAAHS